MNAHLTRRAFLKVGIAGGAALVLPARTVRGGAVRARSRGSNPAPAAPAAGPLLDAADIPQFATPLLVPPAMPRAAKIRTARGRNVDFYDIAVRQFDQQILPAGLPTTPVWGYGPRTVRTGTAIFHAPSLTIEAKHGTPVRVRWSNELRRDPADHASAYLPHLLPVDPTLHWANPPGGTSGRDERPDPATTNGSYRGPVPIVTHVHGAVGVGDESDGYPEAWFLPEAGNIPDGFATEGTWYDFFRAKAARKGFAAPGAEAWAPGTAVFQYPNSQRASTIWYHDHTLGMTRLNVYAGPAGFYLVRGGPADVVVDTRTGVPAILPGPAPAQGDQAGLTYREIPIAIQDRAFYADGSLFYPETRAYFDQIAGPYADDRQDPTDVPPIWNPEFFGNTIMVNGATWPYLEVERARYRFRFLNGCDSRFLILDFSEIPGVDAWVIGNEGGFLEEPLDLIALNGGRLLVGLAERFDVIVDFGKVPVGHHVLRNVGPDEPFPGGEPDEDFDTADPATTGRILEFRVRPTTGRDRTTPPQHLGLPPIHHLEGGAPRRLALLEELSTRFDDAPIAAMLGTVDGNPGAGANWTPLMWGDPITENPSVDSTEVWEFYNATVDAHPIHVHETVFEVVNRQTIVVDESARTVALAPGSTPRLAEPWERGWKDTVTAYPGEVTRVRLRFDVGGQFVWHCHIVSHEDNEMMRPYRIGPVQDGQPT
jgi:FtsP/CotA-like multicopper oxidase with cupredoxin domain